MSKFVREEVTVNGVKTVVHTAGKGETLVFFHGAGTVDGFDFAEAWTDQFRVVVPHHPGFGESGDDPAFTDVHDYVLHYLELFDILKIDAMHLTGISMGAYFAARFALEHSHRVRKLVLIAPYGLDVAGHPALDIIATPGEQLVPMLVSNFDVLKKRLPEKPDMDFVGARYREATSFARLFWEHPIDPKFPRHLHRITMPVLIVWGDQDKVMPVAHAQAWKEKIPQAEVMIVPGAGHIVHLDKPETVGKIAMFLK
ncbi:MAG TPA: alpha/beta hydrolase [Terriglobia bacterium]|nr:alpha/beta hydrolase [Terriglobia bacterium]